MNLSLAQSLPSRCRPTGSPGEQNVLVFVIGLHRSGTTLLARCLAKHSSCSGFSDTGAPMDEGQFLQSVIRGVDGGILDAVGSVGLKPKMRLPERSELATQDNADKLWREWSAHWDLEKKFLIEKSPGNISKTRLLQYYFPSARFIVITRHPIEQVMAIRKWAGNKTYAQHFLNWVAAHYFLYQDMKYLKNKHVVKYEELVTDPEGVLSELFSFLGADIEAATAVGVNSKTTRYMEMYRNLLEDRLFKLQMNALEPLMRPTLRAWGYRLEI